MSLSINIMTLGFILTFYLYIFSPGLVGLLCDYFDTTGPRDLLYLLV